MTNTFTVGRIRGTRTEWGVASLTKEETPDGATVLEAWNDLEAEMDMPAFSYLHPLSWDSWDWQRESGVSIRIDTKDKIAKHIAHAFFNGFEHEKEDADHLIYFLL